jgi:hypothetical protein
MFISGRLQINTLCIVLCLTTPPSPLSAAKNAAKRGRKDFFCEIAAFGGTFCATKCGNLALFFKSPPLCTLKK